MEIVLQMSLEDKIIWQILRTEGVLGQRESSDKTQHKRKQWTDFFFHLCWNSSSQNNLPDNDDESV